MMGLARGVQLTVQDSPLVETVSALEQPWVAILLCAGSLVSTVILVFMCVCTQHQGLASVGKPASGGQLNGAPGKKKRSRLKGCPSKTDEQDSTGSNPVTTSEPADSPDRLGITSVEQPGGVADEEKALYSALNGKLKKSGWFPRWIRRIRRSTRRGHHQNIGVKNGDDQSISVVTLRNSKPPANGYCGNGFTSNTIPRYESQNSRNSNSGRELPPVPARESTMSTGTQSRPTSHVVSTPLSNASHTLLDALAVETGSMGAGESHYDLLIMEEDLASQRQFDALALSPGAQTLPYNEPMHSGPCDTSSQHSFTAPLASGEEALEGVLTTCRHCSCKLEISSDDLTSEIDPLYATIKQKESSCAVCGVVSVYTPASSRQSTPSMPRGHKVVQGTPSCGSGSVRQQHTWTPSSVARRRFAEMVASSPWRHCKHQPGPQTQEKSSVSTPNSQIYSRIRPRHKCAGVIRSEAPSSSASEQRRRITHHHPYLGRLGLGSAGSSLTSLLGCDSHKSDSNWSLTNGVRPPTLPARGYGQSEIERLDQLRSVLLCDKECEGPSRQSQGYSSPRSIITALSKRPAFHQLLRRRRASQPTLSSCNTNLPIFNPLVQSVATYRQNSYSDHQLAVPTSEVEGQSEHKTTESHENPAYDWTEEESYAALLHGWRDSNSSACDTQNNNCDEVDRLEDALEVTNLNFPTAVCSPKRSAVVPPEPPDENANRLLLRLELENEETDVVEDDVRIQLSPELWLEMNSFRHMDSDLDLSGSRPGLASSCPCDSPCACHPPRRLLMTPLMERSMEGSMMEDWATNRSTPRGSSTNTSHGRTASGGSGSSYHSMSNAEWVGISTGNMNDVSPSRLSPVEDRDSSYASPIKSGSLLLTAINILPSCDLEPSG